MKAWMWWIPALVLAILLSFWFYSSSAAVTNYPSSNKEIIAFGDSLIEGVGSTQGNDLVSNLSKKVGLPIRNFGRGGDTTTLALERLPSVLEEVPNPKIVILLLGGNDFLRKIPKEETFKNLSTIIEEFQSRGAIVLLLGIRGGVLKDTFEEEFELLHERYGTAYVSNVLKGLIGRTQFMYDSVHPNNLGYQRVADRVFPVLEKYINP